MYVIFLIDLYLALICLLTGSFFNKKIVNSFFFSLMNVHCEILLLLFKLVYCLQVLFILLQFVILPIIIEEECPVCIQLRSSAIQLGTSVALPAILSPIGSFLVIT